MMSEVDIDILPFLIQSVFEHVHKLCFHDFLWQVVPVIGDECVLCMNLSQLSESLTLFYHCFRLFMFT